MSIPSTANVSPLFVTRGPAWERGMTVKQTMPSDVQTSRNDYEQRQRYTARGRWSQEYTAILNASEVAARRVRAFAEIRAPLWVPFWAEQGVTASGIVSNTVSMDREWSEDFFRPGDYVFFESDTQGVEFRQIASIGITEQELVLTALMGAIAFTSGTRIYPCRLCIRIGGNSEFEEMSEDTHIERLKYSTL